MNIKLDDPLKQNLLTGSELVGGRVDHFVTRGLYEGSIKVSGLGFRVL